MASAPEASRAWLLIEHPGPWPAEPADAEFPGQLGSVVAAAVALGIRVQLIRRPGRREAVPMDRPRAAFAGWTAGPVPWLRRGVLSAVVSPPGTAGSPGPTESPGMAGSALDLEALAVGRSLAFGVPVSEPMFLVCVHGRRNVCCARFGVPLAQSLAARRPGQVWESTHVGGHRFAANLVILPHGLYYGPVDTPRAIAAISAYERGAIAAERYRGRAGQPHDVQVAEHAQLAEAGSLPVAALA
jgi:hypothetical protein